MLVVALCSTLAAIGVSGYTAVVASEGSPGSAAQARCPTCADAVANFTERLRGMLTEPNDAALWLADAYERTTVVDFCEAKYGGLFRGRVSSNRTDDGIFPEWGAVVGAPATILGGLHMFVHWSHRESLLSLLAACVVAHGVASLGVHMRGTVRWAAADVRTMALALALVGGLVLEELAGRLVWTLKVHRFASCVSRRTRRATVSGHVAATASRARMGLRLDAGSELTHLAALYRQLGASTLPGELHADAVARWGAWLVCALYWCVVVSSLLLAGDPRSSDGGGGGGGRLLVGLPLAVTLLCSAALAASELSSRSRREAGAASLLRARCLEELDMSDAQAARVLARWRAARRRGRAALVAGAVLATAGVVSWQLAEGLCESWAPIRWFPGHWLWHACLWSGLLHVVASVVVLRADAAGCICMPHGGLAHTTARLYRRLCCGGRQPRTRTRPVFDDAVDYSAADLEAETAGGGGGARGGGAGGGASGGGAGGVVWRVWFAWLPQLRREEYPSAAGIAPLDVLRGALRHQRALLLVLLRDAHPDERRAALEAFCLLGSSPRAADREVLHGASGRILLALADAEPAVRRAAVQAVGMLGVAALEERQSTLAQLHDHPDGAVRMAVGAALGQVGTARQGRLVHSLLATLAEGDADARLGALAGVAGLPPKVIDEQCIARVLGVIDDAEWSVRAAAVKVVGRLPLEALVLHCAVLLRHQNDGGLEALNQIPRDCYVLLEQCDDADWTARHDAVVAIGRLPPASLALMPRVLLRMMDDSRVGVCSAAAAVLNTMESSTLGDLAAEIRLKLERLPRDGELRAQLLSRLPTKALPPPVSPSAQQRL